MNITYLRNRLFVASLLCITIVTGFQTVAAQEKISLLISLATRSRPHQFFKNLDTFYQKLSHKIPYLFVINCDVDDEAMNNPAVIKRLKGYPNLIFNFDANSSKVEACNRNIDQYDFDILLSVHDDMQALVKGFDEIIFKNMQEYFPDFDGVLNFNDGFVGGQCNTLPVIGRGFYDRFGYIYNPAYKALVCNVELTNVSKMLRKEAVIDEVIIRHNHPAWNAGRHDDLYTRSEAHHAGDLAVFLERRERNFDIAAEELASATSKLWSILICTIEGREESFERLTTKLMNQINALGLCDEIEVLSCKDKRGEHSVGYKRNKLLETSSGYYTQFLDDDDDVHENFIGMLYEKLLKKPDCVSLTGIITFNGASPRKFIHSIQHSEYFERDSVYYRPPNHLNPIKRSITIQFAFPEKNVGEDTDWAMAIARSDLIKTEEVIDIPYYFYLYNDKQ